MVNFRGRGIDTLFLGTTEKVFRMNGKLEIALGTVRFLLMEAMMIR